MVSGLADRLKQKILDCGSQDGNTIPLSYPESSFDDFNDAGLCKPFTTRIPVSTIKVLELLTAATGESRSELVNDLIIEAINKIVEDESMTELKESMATAANAVIKEELAHSCRKGPARRRRRRQSKDHSED
ncbi:MAG: hypothetical protein JKY24_03185 [Pseudomonadales bacterium]|nr:hypothetical protein [Pseudomonadales bacterium]